ncbi:MAG: hypothetical protein WD512_03310 [Candidatus Paceibacterota bacterium]
MIKVLEYFGLSIMTDTDKIDYKLRIKEEMIPLLIREKVEFYYDRKQWLEMIKDVNEEYKEKVYHRSIHNNNSTGNERLCSLMWDNGRRILNLNEYSYIPMKPHIRAIYSFKNVDEIIWYPLPKKYWYSSGLNHPRGYKYA